MGNARPKSEGKQLWRRCPGLRLPNRLARPGTTRHFAGKGGEAEREGERASEEDRGREGKRGARARAARFKRRHLHFLMNIYPPLLPAPGFPYLSAGKIFPESQPWGPAQLPQSFSGHRWPGGRAPDSRVARGVGGRLRSRLGWGAEARDPALARTACVGNLCGVGVSACVRVGDRERMCARERARLCFPRAPRTFSDFSLGRPGFLAFAFLRFPLLPPLTPSNSPTQGCQEALLQALAQPARALPGPIPDLP